MARIVPFPAELRFEPTKQHWPAVTIAAFGADAILVISGQPRSRCSGVLFDLALQAAKAKVSVAEGDKKALLLTEPEDIRLDSLSSSLDALNAMRVH